MNQERRPRRPKKWWLVLPLAGVVAIVSGCRTVSFYTQAVRGEYQILANEKPIDCILADPQTPAQLRKQLLLVQELRAFAAKDLKLPADNHYKKYVDVGRPYVVWNVQAAAQFSLEPKTWWYPLVGRLEYRGYFAETAARDCARRIQARGYDTCVDGVEAYSTLGWFKDPVLNTFVFRPEPDLAEVIFHELGHQRVFCRGDTDFNEAYATTVGEEGARRWLQAGGKTNLYKAYLDSLHRNDQFVHLIMNTRRRLELIYGDTIDADGKVRAAKKLPAPPSQLRREKQAVFVELQRQYATLKAEWGGYSGYDEWFGHELNNAQLNSIANYYDDLPAFEHLLRLKGGDMEKFYHAVEQLSELPKPKRHQQLRALAQGESQHP